MANSGYLDSNPPSPKYHGISKAVEDFDSVLKRIEDYANRLETIRDRIRGAEPQVASPNNNNLIGVPTSIIGAINQQRSNLVEIADRLEYTLRGIEEAL